MLRRVRCFTLVCVAYFSAAGHALGDTPVPQATASDGHKSPDAPSGARLQPPPTPTAVQHQQQDRVPPIEQAAAAASASTEASTPTPPPAALPQKLRVATKVFKPFVIHEDDQFSGFTVELWQLIARELNIEFEWVMTQSVGELLETVAERRADIGGAGITITAERERSVDFSYPFFESGLMIMVRQNPASSPWVVTRALFSRGLMEAIGVVMIIVLLVAHILWFVERKRSPEQFPHEYLKGIWEAFWWSAVTVTTVGYGDKAPVGMLGRLVGLVWMFSGMVLISYFTASVTTELTLSRLESDIQGPRDLRGKAIGTVEGSTAHRYLKAKGLGGRPAPNAETVYEWLEAGTIDAVVYDAPALQYYALHGGNGKVATVGNLFHRESYGFVLPDGSPLRERIDRAMLALRESGDYHSLYAKWFGDDGS